MNFEQLKSHKNVQFKESVRYPDLLVAKYKKKVFFDNLWDDVLVEARGHVYHKDGSRVINSFTKVFNRGENNTDIPRDDSVVAVQKMNGFLGCATYVPQYGEVIVSTTGSLDSDFVGMAKETIGQYALDWIKQYAISTGFTDTYMFEIVHINDPHIINEVPGAYLIGRRHVNDDHPYFSDGDFEWDLDFIAGKMGVLRPMWKMAQFSAIVEEVKSCTHEGFCVYSEKSKVSLKMKSPFYLVQKLLARKKDILTLDKKKVDEEYYDLIDYCRSYVGFSSLDDQQRLKVMRKFLEK
jgi:hypothetical protein